MPGAGWYVDPADESLARWYDGERFTDHTLVAAEWKGPGQPPPPTSSLVAAFVASDDDNAGAEPPHVTHVADSRGTTERVEVLPVVVGGVLLGAFFLSWFNVGGFFGASGFTLVREAIRGLNDKFVVGDLQFLSALLVPLAGIALLATELRRRPQRWLRISAAAVGPGLLVLSLVNDDSFGDTFKYIDIGATVGLVASLALFVHAFGRIQMPPRRWGKADIVLATVLGCALVGAVATPLWQQKTTGDEVLNSLNALADLGKDLDSTFDDTSLDDTTNVTEYSPPTTEPPYRVSRYGDADWKCTHFTGSYRNEFIQQGTITNMSTGTYSYQITGGWYESATRTRIEEDTDFVSDLGPGESARWSITSGPSDVPGETKYYCKVEVEVITQYGDISDE